MNLLVPGVPGGMSLLAQIGGSPVPLTKRVVTYYWPESLNAAMAFLTRQFFETTSAANMVTIDSLEAAYKAKFQNEAPPDKIKNAEDYGVQVANSIFEWSKTDGGHQAYAHIVDPTYIPPVTGPDMMVSGYLLHLHLRCRFIRTGVITDLSLQTAHSSRNLARQ